VALARLSKHPPPHLGNAHAGHLDRPAASDLRLPLCGQSAGPIGGSGSRPDRGGRFPSAPIRHGPGLTTTHQGLVGRHDRRHSYQKTDAGSTSVEFLGHVSSNCAISNTKRSRRLTVRPWRRFSFFARTPVIACKAGSRTMGPGTAKPMRGVTCLACRQVHMVNRRTGRVLGTDEE
jgi:hypothetical protein